LHSAFVKRTSDCFQGRCPVILINETLTLFARVEPRRLGLADLKAAALQRRKAAAAG
jgi:hypothetical protein